MQSGTDQVRGAETKFTNSWTERLVKPQEPRRYVWKQNSARR